jgi:hypothetical protein
MVVDTNMIIDKTSTWQKGLIDSESRINKKLTGAARISISSKEVAFLMAQLNVGVNSFTSETFLINFSPFSRTSLELKRKLFQIFEEVQ